MLQQNESCAYFFTLIIVTGPLYVLRTSLYLICEQLLLDCGATLLRSYGGFPSLVAVVKIS